MVALGLCCCEQAASSGVWWGYALVAAHGLLTVMASLVVEHRLPGKGLQRWWLTGLLRLV